MGVGGKEERENELRKLNPISGIDYRNRNINFDHFKSKMNRKERRALDKSAKKLSNDYLKIISSLQYKGAGYEANKIIREMCIEYNHRYATSGLYNQPLSFNYFDSFCEIRIHEGTVAPYIIPAPEVNHLFSIIDFFEYATGQDSADFKVSSLLDIPENENLVFSCNGNIGDLTFLNPYGHEFVIAGFSMIRRGNYLSWYIVGGEIFSREEWNSDTDFELGIGEVPPWKAKFIKEVSEECGAKSGGRLALSGVELAQRIVIAGEFDLISEKHLNRIYMSEWESCFKSISDDPSIFDYMKDDERIGELRAEFKEKSEELSTIWSIAETLLQLPSYFAFKIGVAKSIAISSGLRQAKKGGEGAASKYKYISSIEIFDDQKSYIREYIPKHYEFERGGYWRKLKIGEYGVGPHGDRVLGKTWESSKETLSQREILPTIFVKSTVAAAKIKISEYVDRLQSSTDLADDKNVLYIMRCMIMEGEVYKVGWTSKTAKERAKELSSASGVPKSFIVVKYWKHENPDKIEKDIHAILDPYRISENREFFKLEYKALERIIENQIKLASSPT